MPGIFISYRREDSEDAAGRLYDALAREFGDECVFMDVDTIRPGDDFVERVEDTVREADTFLAVIGARWLSTTDAQGRRRLESPHDFVRLETQRALERWKERRDIRVIPVLLGDTVMPASEDLPSELGDLWRLHAFRLSHESWGSDIQRLLTQLRAVAEGQLERRKTAEPERAAREREALERAERERAEQQAAEEEQAAREAEVRRPREVETQKRREAEVAVPRGAKAVSPRRQHARWRTPTAVAVVLAVGAVGVGAALLVARGRRDTPSPTDTTTSVTSGPTAQTGASGPSSTLATYRASQFTMRVPALWRLVEDEVDKGTYVESKWRNPANRQDALVIDMSQASGEAPKGQAEPVRQLLRKAESYREISYDATSDLPWQAWRWDFEISDKRRVDYFFSACGHDFAVLGSTSPARFAALGDTFRQVAASVQSGCNGG